MGGVKERAYRQEDGSIAALLRFKNEDGRWRASHVAKARPGESLWRWTSSVPPRSVRERGTAAG